MDVGSTNQSPSSLSASVQTKVSQSPSLSLSLSLSHNNNNNYNDDDDDYYYYIVPGNEGRYHLTNFVRQTCPSRLCWGWARWARKLAKNHFGGGYNYNYYDTCQDHFRHKC